MCRSTGDQASPIACVRAAAHKKALGLKNGMWHLRSIRLGVMLMAAGLLQGVGHAAPWFPLGPYGGDVRSLAADPADPSHHLFLGTATGWIYDSHDGGASWARVSQIANRNDLAVDHILVDRTNPKRLVVGAWVIGKSTDGGIFISEDYGKNWYSQAEMRGQSVRSLARSDSNPQELVSGTLKGVYRSLDNGVHWQQISPAGSTEIHEVESVAIDPADPDVIYAGTWHLPWKTTDGGTTWHSIKDGLIDDSDVFSIIVDPKQPSVVYASACSGIYKSSDAGEQFHKVQGIPSAARRTRKLTEDPEKLDTVFAGTTEGLYRTLDAGSQWDRLTPADIIVNDVYIDPADSQNVLIATDRGGVYRSGDGGTTFEPSNMGFSARQITSFAQDAGNPSTLYVGLVNDKATGGVFESTDGAVHWRQQSEGLDGRDVFSLLSLPDGGLLAGTVHGIFRFADGSWTDSSLLEKAGEKPGAKDGTSAPAHPVASATPHSAVSVDRPSLRLVGYSYPQAARPPKNAQRIPATRRTLSAQGRPAKPQASGRLPNRKAAAHRTAGARPAPLHPPGKHVAVAHGAHPRGAAAPQSASLARAAAVVPSQTARTTSKPNHFVNPGQVSATIYTLASAQGVIFAGGAEGMLRSSDGGQHWATLPVDGLPEVHFLAVSSGPQEATSADAPMLLAAGLTAASLSVDGGTNWTSLTLPNGLTEIGAVGMDGENNLWIGGREGAWYSTDRGVSWKTLRNLFLTQVDSLYYDAGQHRMLVTAATSKAAFSVQGPDRKVTYADTGWKLRFVRPVGDHLVAATLFDGMVVQPEMVATPVTSTEKASN